MEEEISWAKLVEHEPKLKDLYEEARSIKPEPGEVYCANFTWYSPEGRNMKKRMMKLVGIMRSGGPGILRTSEAYDLAYKKIYNALPACRGCGCLDL